MKMYQHLAQVCGAYHRCVAAGNQEWEEKWKAQIDEMLEEFPHGSGFDSGTKIDLEASGDDKLVFTTGFHHMNEGGMYDGWTEHTITVLSSLGLDFHLKIGGRDRNQIKEYISECFSSVLNQEIVETPPKSLNPHTGPLFDEASRLQAIKENEV